MPLFYQADEKFFRISGKDIGAGKIVP